jgi:hypothetical protein
MTIPSYLNVLFNFTETPGETDVANTITRIQTKAVALGWTNPLAGKVVSPANPVGQQLTLQFNKIAAGNLEMVFTDSFNRTFTRRAQTGGGAFTERLYVSQFSMFIDFSNGEGLWGSILDCAPDPQNSHDQTFAGHGARTSADALDGLFVTSGSMKLDASSPRLYVANADSVFIQRFVNTGAVAGRGMTPFSQGGSRYWFPIWQEGISSGTQHRIRGRIINALMVSDSEAAQTELVVPLDESNTGTFKVLAFTNTGTRLQAKFAVRKS